MKIDKTYRIALDVDITTGSKISNQDGSYVIEYVAEIEKGEVLKETGEVILSKSNDSQSNKLRKQIFAINEDYDDIMNWIRGNLDTILEMKYKLNK